VARQNVIRMVQIVVQLLFSLPMFVLIVVQARKHVSLSAIMTNTHFCKLIQRGDGTIEKVAVRLALVNAMMFVLMIGSNFIGLSDSLLFMYTGVRCCTQTLRH
jgi:hypothetical protein